jgi:hypothetical protein
MRLAVMVKTLKSFSRHEDEKPHETPDRFFDRNRSIMINSAGGHKFTLKESEAAE